MISFSHRFTFGLCVSVIALTAIVVAAVTLALHKHHDNSLLHRHINTLKAENAQLREQLLRYRSEQTASGAPAQAAGDPVARYSGPP